MDRYEWEWMSLKSIGFPSGPPLRKEILNVLFPDIFGHPVLLKNAAYTYNKEYIIVYIM